MPTDCSPTITQPIQGAVLNRRHGRQTDDGLWITVRGQAPGATSVEVNGHEARLAGAAFEVDIPLTARETTITATAATAAADSQAAVTVLWDVNSMPRYRFSIDDNSFFLRDIVQQQYASLFDCFYLRMFRDIHQQYGAKFVLNLFFTTPENDFLLADFPERHKGEWQDNADWLSLAFHAWTEFPDRPYQDGTVEQLAHDLDAVSEEIIRFAGETVLSPPTVVHWAMTTPEMLPVLAARGVRVLSGFFQPLDGGAYDINYGLPDDLSAYIGKHDAWHDFDAGITYSQVDLVANMTLLAEIVPKLEPLTGNPDQAEIMDLFTHEQYTWPFYQNYIPDHAERIAAAARFCSERGYAPVFFHEGFLGADQ